MQVRGSGGMPSWIFFIFSCKLVQYGGFWRMLLGYIFSFVVTGGGGGGPSRTPPNDGPADNPIFFSQPSDCINTVIESSQSMESQI